MSSSHALSSLPESTAPSLDLAAFAGGSRRERSFRGIVLAVFIAALVSSLILAASAHARENYLLMPRSELLSLPTSGSAWKELKDVADQSWGAPDLCDPDVKHGTRALAGALVFARTGTGSYERKTRNAILSAMGTERGSDCSVLSIGRQLGSYVLAADFIGLDGGEFRAWLSGMRTRVFTGHSRWQTLVGTHKDSANNWGAFAGASRIAASLFLGDKEDVERAADVLRGFFGNRSAWSNFRGQDGEDALLGRSVTVWSCDPDEFVPIDPPCTRSGVNLDGAIVNDVSRDEQGLTWPVGPTGIGYTLESLQGLTLQAELLYRNGYEGAWGWSDSALRRVAGLVSRNGRAGGPTWNRATVNYHVPWILNFRYGLDLPTRSAMYGRIFGYTDWLYGARRDNTDDSTIIGNESRNVLVGTSSAETIDGNGGNDDLYGNGGGDTLIGGTGWDKIDGESGHDTVRANRGHDRIVGGEGEDRIRGGRGPDIIFVSGDGSDDFVDCGPGWDVVYYSSGDNTTRCEVRISR